MQAMAPGKSVEPHEGQTWGPAAVLGGGAIITETVYTLHGVGYYAYQSIQTQDLPPLMGVTLYGAAFIVVFSTLIDIAYAYLDPRVKYT